MGRCVARKALSEFLDGELAVRAAEAIRSHLAECPKCAKALAELEETEAVLKRHLKLDVEVPDLAPRVTEELRQRGEFLMARVAAKKRWLFGEQAAPLRAVGSFALAIVIFVLVMAGIDYASQRDWARRTEPVLADAERVLVRLTLVNVAAEEEGLAKARQEARQFDLSTRLAGVRAGASAGVADDVAYLEEAFALMADDDPLPPELVLALTHGEVLKRAEHLRSGL